VQQFRGGLVFKAHGLLYHSTLGLRLIKKKRRVEGAGYSACGAATESVAYFLRSREKYGGSLCKILVVLSVEGKILVVLSVVLSMVVLSVEGRQPRGGVPPSPQESTCLNIINFRAACGINFVTPPPKFGGPETLVLRRVAERFPHRKVDVRLPGKGNSNSHSARPVHLIVTVIKWIRTSRLPINHSFPHRMATRKECDNAGSWRISPSIQGCLAHKKLHPPRTLMEAYA